MNKSIKYILLLMFWVCCINCSPKKKETFTPQIVYKSEHLVITQISKNTFIHTSYLQTNDFGKVPCNGLIVRSQNETIVYDTPTDDTSTEALINWVEQELKATINAIIPTHFHKDCLGRLHVFHNRNIPSYAHARTIKLAIEHNYAIPQNSFDDSLVLQVGNHKTNATYFGAGHTSDNIVGYFPSENVMFGGCLIKELNANKGNLEDADTITWSNTVTKVKNAYPNVKIIVPGHGQFGDKQLLNYTINLFKRK